MERVDILKAAIQKWGFQPQAMMCIEECSELIKALCKFDRLKLDVSDEKLFTTVDNILEEVADVQIMLDQLRLIFGDTTDFEERKLLRLEELLKNE